MDGLIHVEYVAVKEIGGAKQRAIGTRNTLLVSCIGTTPTPTPARSWSDIQYIKCQMLCKKDERTDL